MAGEMDRGAPQSADHLYPVDIFAGKDSEDLWENTIAYHASVIQQSASSQEYFLTSEEKRVTIETSSLSLHPLYHGDPKHSLLVLRNPLNENSDLAVYLNQSWWPIEDILKTSNSLREGLLPVESLGERIVLFVLNCLIFGGLEKGSEDDPDGTCFVSHSAREKAKILWQRGEASAFYTVKPKGSLCDGSTSQCYMLPVLDTAFVRRSHRRRGLMTAMLRDFCRCFRDDDALGLSCPVSADMYKVCQKFFRSFPEERDRLWEVEAPGDWSQRENIWLQIQLKRRESTTCEALKASSNEPNDRAVEKDVDENTSQSELTQDVEVTRLVNHHVIRTATAVTNTVVPEGLPKGLSEAALSQKSSGIVADMDDGQASTLLHHPQVDTCQGSTNPCEKTQKRKLEEDGQGHNSVKLLKSSS